MQIGWVFLWERHMCESGLSLADLAGRLFLMTKKSHRVVMSVENFLVLATASLKASVSDCRVKWILASAGMTQ
jgi:hypothetical protein